MDPNGWKSCVGSVRHYLPSILPYIFNLNTCVDILTTVEKRLASSNRFCIIHLKGELYNPSMQKWTKNEYLTYLKTKVDLVVVARSPINTDDIIYYTLNDLTTSYQSFKTTIRTNLLPLSFYDLYSLLCSEETLQCSEASHNELEVLVALATTEDGMRPIPPTEDTLMLVEDEVVEMSLSARFAANSDSRQLRVGIVRTFNTLLDPWINTTHTSSTQWLLDLSAFAHLSNDASQLSSYTPYQGSEQIIAGNRHKVKINNEGHGVISTPSRKLGLSRILHAPTLSHNNCSIVFDANEYTIKDQTNNRQILIGLALIGSILYTFQNRPSPLFMDIWLLIVTLSFGTTAWGTRRLQFCLPLNTHYHF